ncbi:MAG: carboxypeptidase regulatory-like domain-containing protein [Gammaproteobacteria bacterium]|nr:carboxypeptidase regulatory-like domain-containing protein [Gammaproteobacteria bacterium]
MTITTAVLALALQQSSLVGVVRDSANSEPVAFARVTVAVQGAQAREATADRFGAFVVTGIASGEAVVEVRAL